jgi:hypothetical protein
MGRFLAKPKQPRQQMEPTPSQSQLLSSEILMNDKSRHQKDLLTFEYTIIIVTPSNLLSHQAIYCHNRSCCHSRPERKLVPKLTRILLLELIRRKTCCRVSPKYCCEKLPREKQRIPGKSYQTFLF